MPKPYVLIVTAAFFALCSSRCAAAADTVSLETIRAAIRDHVGSVTSISTKYRLYYKYGPIAAYRDIFGGQSWGPQQCEWAEQGSQKLLRSDPIAFESGKLALAAMWVSYDGATGYSVNFDSADLSRPQKYLRKT